MQLEAIEKSAERVVLFTKHTLSKTWHRAEQTTVQDKAQHTEKDEYCFNLDLGNMRQTGNRTKLKSMMGQKVPWITKPGGDPKGVKEEGNQEQREEGGGTSKKRGAKRAEVKKYRDPVKEDYMLWETRSGDRCYPNSGFFHPSLPHSYKLQLGNLDMVYSQISLRANKLFVWPLPTTYTCMSTQNLLLTPWITITNSDDVYLWMWLICSCWIITTLCWKWSWW